MRKTLSVILLALCAAAIPVMPAHADETPAQLPDSLVSRAVSSVEDTIERAFEFIGVRYKRGGSSPETGFDCSGFVKYLYNETLGLVLPHSAKAIAQQGERVEKSELQPGDLVFFNTMRRAFSHVGIYLGNNQFIHAPRTGTRVRVEDMSDRYWSRRYNGARRIQQ
jgi:cell wall-associated NlpC family hydrolase